jgi:hypothetical protein
MMQIHARVTVLPSIRSRSATLTEQLLVDSGISFDPTDGTVCLDGGALDTDYHVDFTYTDECGEKATGTATVNFILCCPPLDPDLEVVVDNTSPCSGDPATITSVTATWGGTSHEFNPSYAGITGLSWVVRAADVGKIDFDGTTGEVTLTSGVIGTDYHVDFTYTDECGEKATGTATVNFILCCIEPIIDLLEFRVQLPGNGGDFEDWTNMFGYVYSTEPEKTNPVFDPGTSYYDINTGEHGTPKFGFKVVDACGTLDLKYNWYRGDNCTADWLEYDNNTDNWYTLSDGRVVPGWRDISIGGIYPILNSENSLCNKGGNILVIKVTGDTGNVQIYRIDINRVVPAG